jgi:ribosome maturation factor RimP
VIEQQIDTLLAAKFQEEGFQDCFLIEVNHHENNKLEVFIDSDMGVTFDKCRKISRYLEAIIDEQGWMGEKYVLEVSSAGIGRPLRLWRQYKKNIGRTLDITLKDGSRRQGVLGEVKEDVLLLEELVVALEGKKKVKKTVASAIAFDDIQKAVIKIQF